MPKLEPIVEREDHTREGTIIFVHGLGGDAFATWGGKDRKDPNYLLSWLKEDLKSYSIYSTSYAAEVSGRDGNTISIAEIGRSFFEVLNAHAKIIQGPIAFVGHSLGGLVIKHMLQWAAQHGTEHEEHPIIANTAEVVFLATPHIGSAMATAAMNRTIGAIVKPSTIVKGLAESDDALSNLNQWYRDFCAKREHLRNKIYFETRKTRYGLFNLGSALVVSKDSANAGLVGVTPIAVEDDHISICKPADQHSSLYKPLATFLSELSSEGRRVPERKPATAKGQAGGGANWHPHALIATGAAGAFALALAGLILKLSWPAGPVAAPVAKAELAPAPAPHVKAEQAPSRPAFNDEVEKLRKEREAIELAKAKAEADRREAAKAQEDERIRQQQLAAEQAKADLLAREQAERADATREAATSTDRAVLQAIRARFVDLAPVVEKRLAELDQADSVLRAKLATAVQEGLKRAGCFTGPVNGKWGPLSKSAAAQYNRLATTPIAVETPTSEAAQQLAVVKARVCPLKCEAPKVERNGACETPATTVPAPSTAGAACPPGQIRVGAACAAGYVAWIGAEVSEAAATALFTDIQKRHPDVLAPHMAMIKASDDRSRYSVRVGPGSAKDAISELCARLKAAGFDRKCYPAPM